MGTLSLPTTQKRNLFGRLVTAGLVSLALLLLAIPAFIIGFQIYYGGSIFPGVTVAGISLEGLSRADAAGRISQQLTYSQNGKIFFRDGDAVWGATPGQLGFFFDPEASAQRAYQVGRSGSIRDRLNAQIKAWWTGVNLAPVVVFDQRAAQRYLQGVAAQLDRPAVEASLGLNGAEVQVRSGQVGRALDIPATLMLMNVQLATLQDAVVPLVVRETPPVILDASAQAEIARKILSAPLDLSLPAGMSDAGPWSIDQQTLASVLSIERVQNGAAANFQVGINSEFLRSYLSNLAPSLARYPQNARFIFNDETRQLDLLQNAVIGRELDVDASIQAINQKIAAGEHSIPLVMSTTAPPVTDNATADQLGIKELVIAQTSYFYGSSAARVQNIKAASSRFHGLLIAPGETFSMAQALGDISLDNGYAEALIIVGDQTIKGVGGGVCQVSTTLFRTVFFGGYPVNERHAHAYRVSYYEQKRGGGVDPDLAGLDATVFVPLVDFKFTNDTPYWLLMETYLDGYSLTWKFYSTSDGRTVDWNTTGITDKQDPPDPQYKENSDLPQGEIKQVEWAVAGANVTVNRTVSRDGSTYFTDTFSTHYVPWRDVFEYGPGTEGIPEPDSGGG